MYEPTVPRGFICLAAFAGVLAFASCEARRGSGGGPSAGEDAASQYPTPSFADFERRARAGGRLTVVFFGASLTWGANATDPQLTSYRALTADRLRERYPEAHFRFFDAGLGGTGSQLGVFRLERDVLRRKPDLVFLDFSANDDINSADPETLASYEAIVRRIVTEGNAPVVIAVFPFKWDVARGNTAGMKGREAHLEIAKAYNCPAGDAIVGCQERVKAGETTVDAIWPVDGAHPCDHGYRLFTEAVWRGFLGGVERGIVCRAPERMLHAPTYMTSARVRISSLGPLPPGWRVGRPHLTSAWYDALMSRWLDDLVIASNRRTVTGANGKKRKGPQEVARLAVRFRGSTVLLFGEKTTKSCKYRVYLDGKVVTHKDRRTKKTVEVYDASSKLFGGNVHLTQLVATGLDPPAGGDAAAEHTLEIEPVFASGPEAGEQELRLESICVAGEGAKVRPKR